MTVEDERELIRPQYKPNIIRVLFVGESLAAGGTFFYKADSNLYRYTQEAFHNLFGDKCGMGQQFLQFFKQLGFYFVDLCNEPVNRMSKPERLAKCREGIHSLSLKVADMQPLGVIALMKGIEQYVRTALEQARVSTLLFSVPFPARGNQRLYVQELSKILRRLVQENIITA